MSVNMRKEKRIKKIAHRCSYISAQADGDVFELFNCLKIQRGYVITIFLVHFVKLRHLIENHLITSLRLYKSE